MKNLTEVRVNECQTTKGMDFLKSTTIMNKYDSNLKVAFQNGQISSGKHYLSDSSNYEVCGFLNSERENLRNIVIDLKSTYNYLLNKTDELWDESEFEFDFNELLLVDNIEEIKLDGITSKVMLLRDEIHESGEVDLIVKMCDILKEIKLSIRTINKMIEILSE